MYNLTPLHDSYLNYQLTRKKTMAKKTGLEAVLNLAIVFLVVIFCAQLLSAWRFEADAHDLIGCAKKLWMTPIALAAESTTAVAEVSPYTTNLIMKSGQEMTVSLTYINRGNTIWPANQTTLETGPFLKTSSKIQHISWLSFFKVLALPKDVKPGEKIILSFKINAPEAKYIGVLQENFQLVYNQQPIKNSLARVFVDANQAKPTFVVNSTNSNIIVSTVKTSSVSSNSASNIKYITGYDKLGQVVKVVKGQYVPGISLVKPSTVAIAAEKARLATIVSQSKTVPAVSTNPTTIADDVFCIALSESERLVSSRCQTSNDESQAGVGIVNYAKKLNQEPLIRVGLFTSDQSQTITSDQPFNVYAGSNLLVGSIPASTLVSVAYAKSSGQYTVVIGDDVYQTTSYLRFVSQADNAGVFQLVDYRNNPNWSVSLNDNKFRRLLEYRYTPKTDKVWWINELPVNSYLQGLAETSNASPVEFQKVLVTAARTYVLYHYYRGIDFGIVGASTKHADEYFHVDATYDQVYRGYNSEIRMPRLTQAINETDGAIVTYNNELAITPYFSRSDGRTRSWNEVWGGGDKAWLQSVAVPEDSGKTLFGHGVGMSAQGALLMIVDNHKTWQEVLGYFYQGTILQKAY